MDRTILLALLGIPVLVIIHIALFAQPIPWTSAMFWAASGDGTQLQGHWQSPEQTLPSHFAIERTTEQGS